MLVFLPSGPIPTMHYNKITLLHQKHLENSFLMGSLSSPTSEFMNPRMLLKGLLRRTENTHKMYPLAGRCLGGFSSGGKSP